MKRKDVIEGLECCISDDISTCNLCPYWGLDKCRKELMKDALETVKRFDEIITLFKESR